MIKGLQFGALLLCVAWPYAHAQKTSEFPQRVVIASDSFIDMGPPFDYYEITTINSTSSGLHVERVRIAAATDSCLQLPTLEWQHADLPITLPQLLQGKNPCDIPEKDLNKELKRCKHCLTFSGINVSMEMSCKTKPRTIRMDILDRDLFDSRTATPGNTSWTMKALGSLNNALGPGPWEKPIFNLEMPTPVSREVREAKIVQALKAGEFDHFFPSNSISPETLSKLAKEAEQLPSVQTIALAEAKPYPPAEMRMPSYPPIARAAHVEGDVSLGFEVTPEGKTEHIVFFGDGRLLMLHDAVKEAITKWTFVANGERYHESATISFRLNCAVPDDRR